MYNILNNQLKNEGSITMTLAEFIKDYRKRNNLSQRKFAEICRLSNAYISFLENENNPTTGRSINSSIPVLKRLAKGMNISLDKLLKSVDNFKLNVNEPQADNVSPLPKTKKVPRLGTIACGEPILAEQNVDTYDNVDVNVSCDFSLKCQGDSMINARIFDGDIVFIKKQPDVENGQIAAVLIGNEATLKKVHKFPNKLVLSPCNPLYDDIIYTNEQLNDVKILGKAVCFLSYIK